VLAVLLDEYPDQGLLSFVTRGTSSKTFDSIGLVMVLGPHLQSLATAFDAVAATIDGAVKGGLCGSVDREVAMFAFVPGYSIPQGAVAKKDGDTRRSSDYGCPRKETSPPATAINNATRAAGSPREEKPTNAQLAAAVAVLRLAADMFGEDLFVLSEDFKAWFNQFGVHPSEWFKQTFQWLRRGPMGELIPTWLCEYVMGFGMANSSGIAQRFADALLWLLLRRFDESESALLAAEPNEVRRAFLAERAQLGPHQAALWYARCFTDDTFMVVVGADRCVRLMICWGELIDEVGVVTKRAKRQAGCCILWNGAFTNTFLANQVIPPDKVLRAVLLLRDVVNEVPVIFSEYRSVMGLVIHLRQLLRISKRSTYHMFRPFVRGWLHPAAPIHTTALLRANAAKFVVALLHSAGASCSGPPTATFDAAPFEIEDLGRAFFAYVDAALQGAPVPGLGGWMHGLYFSFALPTDMLGYPIVQLEFLGIILAHMTFSPIVGKARHVLVTDSETSWKIIVNDSARKDETQWLHEALLRVKASHGCFDQIRHGYGETNPFADLASRGRLRELIDLAKQMGIKTTRLPIPSKFLSLLDAFKAEFGPREALPGALREHKRRDRTPPSVPPPRTQHAPLEAGAQPAVRSAAQLAAENRQGKGYSSDITGDGPTRPEWWSPRCPTSTTAPPTPRPFSAAYPTEPPPRPSRLQHRIPPCPTSVPMPPTSRLSSAAAPNAAPPSPHRQPICVPSCPKSVIAPPTLRPYSAANHTAASSSPPRPAIRVPPCPTSITAPPTPRRNSAAIPKAAPPFPPRPAIRVPPCPTSVTAPPTHRPSSAPGPTAAPPPRTRAALWVPPCPTSSFAPPKHRPHSAANPTAAPPPTPRPQIWAPPPPLSSPATEPAWAALAGTPLAQERRRRHTGGPCSAPESAPSPFDFDSSTGLVAGLFNAVSFAVHDGIPDGTLKKDDLAWSRWETLCASVCAGGTPPWRTDRAAHSGANPAGFERESRLLCVFFLWCYDLIKPRSKEDAKARPQSAFNMVMAVRRIHDRHNITMVSCKQLAAVLKSVTLRHIREHGPESILPNRKGALCPSVVRKIVTTPNGTKAGSRVVDWKTPLFLSLGTMFAVAMSTGTRKAEAALPNGEKFDDRRLRRSSVVYRINGKVLVSPTPKELLSMVPGRDYAIIRPPRAKNDWDGTKFGSHPIYLILDYSDPINAASWLVRLELAFPCHGSDRRSQPLFFSDASFTPMSHSIVDTYLRIFLRLYLSEEEAERFSFHSFRIGFATALLAAGCSFDTIKALVRWSSDESVLIYARMDPESYTAWVKKALRQETASITGMRLPFPIDNDDVMATFSKAEACFAAAKE
jgi:integrase